MRLVVFGWGNVSRGDDGVGPLLLARIEAAGWSDATVIEDFQLQLEHALDIGDHQLVLFVDAGVGTPAPFAFSEIASRAGMTHTSHALSPQSVLDVYRQISGKAPPPAFLLSVRGECFDLGAGLSRLAGERLEAAWALLQRLNERRSLDAWRAMTSERDRAERD